MMLLGARSVFSASHVLPNHKELHGHSYEVWVFIDGNEDAEWLRSKVRDVCEDLDHKTLNGFIDPPTMERIAEYIAREVGKGSCAPYTPNFRVVRVCINRPLEGLSAEYSTPAPPQ